MGIARRTSRKRAIAGILAVALVALAPAAAQAKKVSQTAAPFALPDATLSGTAAVLGEGSQTFRFKGGKVKGRQITDVDLTVNAIAAAANQLAYVEMILIAPKGDLVRLNVGSEATSWVDITFDAQASQQACIPLIVTPRCKYASGGVISGPIRFGDMRAAFRGGNPKGTWRLLFQDTFVNSSPPISVGTSTLELNVARKFEKEGK